MLAALLLEIADGLRRGEFGLDLIAALAMAGALILGEHLAGIVIALMYAGGQALESFAQRRARREMTALLARAPRAATRYDGDTLVEVPLDAIRPDDRLLVRQGEIVPVDGIVAEGSAVLDESALTGEAMPVRRAAGEPAISGATNAGDPFDLIASHSAGDSTYAGIVRLVAAAQADRAPIARLADRYALLFLAVTLVLAGGAWLFSGDPVRALAVLVVATPCPLILAVPVAIVSGVSRCARRGILVKGGGALERLATPRTVLLDKTGTLTDGEARLLDLRARPDGDPMEMLRLAASLDQGSGHVAARALVQAARDRGLALDPPRAVREEPGAGIEGEVGGRRVAVGGWSFVAARAEADAFAEETGRWLRRPGTMGIAVAVDGAVAGAVLLADEVRPETGRVLRHLRAAGAERIVLVTGDRADLAQDVAAFLGLDRVVAESKPDDKLRVVAEERRHGPVLMIGDGVNDAPALAAADVGVAMGARGAAAAAESADVVILVDRLDRLVAAVRIAQRSRAIALQSVLVGIGLSVAAMMVAALGYLTPVQGALLQEAIDVLVILNALRALGRPLFDGRGTPALSRADLLALEAEHRGLAEVLDRLRLTAEQLPTLPDPLLRRHLAELEALLHGRLLPHERHDDTKIYAALRRKTGAIDALSGMSRTHMEIQRLVHAITALRRALGDTPATAPQRHELQRLLHGLEAITRLHFAQEEEIYRALEAE